MEKRAAGFVYKSICYETRAAHDIQGNGASACDRFRMQQLHHVFLSFPRCYPFLSSSSPFSGAAYRCLESALSISLTYVRAHRLTTATLWWIIFYTHTGERDRGYEAQVFVSWFRNEGRVSSLSIRTSWAVRRKEEQKKRTFDRTAHSLSHPRKSKRKVAGRCKCCAPMRQTWKMSHRDALLRALLLRPCCVWLQHRRFLDKRTRTWLLNNIYSAQTYYTGAYRQVHDLPKCCSDWSTGRYSNKI